jgi:hypothetical protein
VVCLAIDHQKFIRSLFPVPADLLPTSNPASRQSAIADLVANPEIVRFINTTPHPKRSSCRANDLINTKLPLMQ